MRDRKLQVGLVGAGGIGRSKHLPGWAKVPFAEVLGMADVSEEALSRAAQVAPNAHTYHDWHELVARDDIDAIDVCTPNRTHAAIVLAALTAGKHVLCEKPLATSADEVRAMRDAAASAGRLLMAAQHFRFDPAARQLKALIDAGMLGSVYYTRAQWLRRRFLPVRTTFIERRLSGGGPVFDIGVHVLDLAYWFLGAPEPVSVSAFVDAKLAHDPQLTGSWGDWDHARFDVEDFTAGLVRFRDGGVLLLEASWLGFQPEKELTRVQCYGTRGGLVWPDGLVVGETNRVPWDLKLSEVPDKGPHDEEILAFATAVRDGLPSPVPVEESLNVVRILEAFYRSGQERREVPVE
ncbi:MAG TPA: Gfo/Idh/MocA family oxidoreductase [Gemmataceae bacterium]|nr:Gfo/Idh/MocA family oxidoreductase [Gemmataceae bacterium]